ncbi:MAG: guanylate kinase [Gammaproteobacteria bacterium]|nr:guanylate kinase [Gammaproteobacteria bacterium]MDH5304892.1 guanylate kinase [Gammaproteobacteria bacterium]MDH5322819.1 guanylate kinase [Gammaproteobacteria bacterium]
MPDAKSRLYVFAAPSGAGKTTLVHAMMQHYPGLRFSISYTTRQPRRNEADGVNYFFVSREQFEKLRASGEMLEWATVFDHLYGTSRKQVEKILADGHDVLLEIDWQGARQVRASMPDCVTVFILPPSVTELERRLRDRRTDSEAAIARRLRDALNDMQHWEEFDYIIINDRLDDAVADLDAVFTGRGDAQSVSNPKLRRRIHAILDL